ncbi:MAG: hydrolase, partial [Simkaniaceae bacterium]|nr:hydrolase [Simkaniaceae bacterium]
MGNENLPDEQRQDKENWWSQGDRGTRLLIGILIALCLSAFLHFREVRVEILEPGTLAKHYVVAQVDFDFPDDEATNMLRQESFRDLGAVYQIDPDEIESRAKDFQEYLVNHTEWRRDEALFTFDEVSDAINSAKDEMLSSRFTDPRTFQKLREMKMSTENMHVFAPPSSDERG